MRKVVLILTLIAFIVSCVWAYNIRDYEPYLAVVTTLAGLIGLWITDDSSKPSMNQRGGRKSANYQSVGDMHVSINDKKKKQDE